MSDYDNRYHPDLYADEREERNQKERRRPSPGKKTLTAGIASYAGPGRVQLKARGGGSQAEQTSAAAAALSSKGAGQQLPGSMQRPLSESYGVDAAAVRVHTDSNAGTAAARMNAAAFTYGNDIFFAANGYQPDTERGEFVIAHEVAHVAQQAGGAETPQTKLEVGDPHDMLETEADAAATDAMAGRRASISRGGAMVRRFEAGGVVRTEDVKKKTETWKVKPGGHAEMTVEALKKMGLDDKEASIGYQGNWARDFSQALTPGLVAILKEKGVYTLLNLISIKEFGRGISAAELGTYDPVEHMDNPTDLRGSDVFKQTTSKEITDPETGKTEISIAGWNGPTGTALPNPDAAGSGLKPGPSDQGYAITDPRYADTSKKLAKEGKALLGEGVDAFKVDSSGIPVYLSTSKEWSKKTITHSATLGSKSPKEVKKSAPRKSGPREFSSGIHTLQDYYSHSNFLEIAVNMLIREGGLEYMGEDGEIKKLSKKESEKTLDTGVYKNDKKGDPIKSYNLKLSDLKGFKGGKMKDREVVQTGSFNLTDTAVSLLSVAKEKLLALNPFENKSGPSPLMMAVMDLMDMNAPDQFNKTGAAIAELMRPVSETIRDIGEKAAGAVSSVGDTAGDVAKGAGKTGGKFFSGLNWVNAKLGGDDDYWDDEKKAVEGAGKGVSNIVTGKTRAAAKQITMVTGWLDKKADDISAKEHILRDLYTWWSGADLLAPLKALARKIPFVGKNIVLLIIALQKKIKELINEALKKGWDIAAKKGAQGIQEAIAWVTSKTNIEKKKKAGVASPKGPDWLPKKARGWLGAKVAEVEKMLGGVGDLYEDGRPTKGIAAPDYTPPSHSEKAKDHSDKGKKDKGDGKAATDKDRPVGEGEWLNPVAEMLAKKASLAVAGKVKPCWDKVDAGGSVPVGMLEGVGKEVDLWFQHPADMKGAWEASIRAKLREPRIAKYLRAKMKMNARK